MKLFLLLALGLTACALENGQPNHEAPPVKNDELSAECLLVATAQLREFSGMDSVNFIQKALQTIATSQCPSENLVELLDKTTSLRCDHHCIFQEK